MEDRPNEIEQGDVAWCHEFGLVEVAAVYEPDEDLHETWAVRVKLDTDHYEVTDLHNLQSDIPVVRWSWEDSDTGTVFVYGYDLRDRHVVTRMFKLESTTQQGPAGTRPFIDEEGSWSKPVPASSVFRENNE